MASELPPGIYSGKITIRPTELLKWLFFAAVFLVITSGSSSITIAPILTTLILVVIDAGLVHASAGPTQSDRDLPIETRGCLTGAACCNT